MKVVPIIVLLFLLSLGSCSSPSGNSTPPTTSPTAPASPASAGKIAKFNVSGARALAIGKASGTSASLSRGTSTTTGQTNKLLKVSTSGSVLEIDSTDSSGDIVTLTQNPTMILPIQNSYFLLVFQLYPPSCSDAYIVRSSDGTAFEVPSDKLPYSADGAQQSPYDSYLLQVDPTGNPYWLTPNQNQPGCKLYKVNLSEPANIQVTLVNKPTDVVMWFVMNPNGDLIYRFDNNNGQENGYRVVSKNGTFTDLPGMPGNILLDPNGNFEYTDSLSSNTLTTLVVNPDGPTSTSSVTLADYSFAIGWYSKLYSVGGEEFSVQEGVYFPNNVSRVFSSARGIAFATANNLSVVEASGASSSAIFLGGLDSSSNAFLLSYSPATNSYQTILPGTDSIAYHVTTMSVAQDGSLMFGGVRTSDGANVLGSISSSGVTTILSTSAPTLLSILQVSSTQ